MHIEKDILRVAILSLLLFKLFYTYCDWDAARMMFQLKAQAPMGSLMH